MMVMRHQNTVGSSLASLRRALLVGAALVPGMLTASAAWADCGSTTIGSVLKVECTGNDANGFATSSALAIAVSAGPSATVGSNAGQSALRLTSDVSITAGPYATVTTDPIGGSFTGDLHGINFNAPSISLTSDGASFVGTTGDGARLISGAGGVVVFATDTTFSGGERGLRATGDEGLIILTGGSVTGTNGDGMNLAIDSLILTSSAEVTGGRDGIHALAGGTDATVLLITQSGKVEAERNGIWGRMVGPGLVSVDVEADVTATNGNAVQVSHVDGEGSLIVNTGAGTTLTAGGYGIRGVMRDSSGPFIITTGENSVIDATVGGIYARKVRSDDELVVTTGKSSKITTDGTGIEVIARDFTTGANNAVFVNTGESSRIDAKTGIIATGEAVNGRITVTTGTSSLIVSEQVGIQVTKNAKSREDSVVIVGESASVKAGTDAIVVQNNSTELGDDATAATYAKSVVDGNNDAIRISASQVAFVDINGTRVRGDTDDDGTGHAINVEKAKIAIIGINGPTAVVGSGATAAQAVILSKADETELTVSAKATVTSNIYYTDFNAATRNFAIDTSGGGKSLVDNYGTIIGRINLSGDADTIENRASGFWYTQLDNQFGAGEDIVRNAGIVYAAHSSDTAETTRFLGLETFSNSGLLTMIDETPGTLGAGAARDTVYVSGVFTGQAGSRLGVDAYLGGPGSTSDKLVVGGLNASGNPISGVATPGQTQIVVHDVNTGPGDYNPGGILVVDVQNGTSYGKNDPSNPASFVLAPDSTNYSAKNGGVIDKGLFVYDLVTRDNDTYLVSAPDADVYQLASLATGAQSIWHDTTGVWLDRQADLRTYLQGSPTTLVTKDGVKTINGGPASVTPGIWGKAIGSWASRDQSSTYANGGGTFTYDTSYSQDTYGFIAGADFGREGVGSPDGTLIFGVLGGYITSKLSFDNSSTSATYSGGTVGAYVTYLNANWFVDAVVKADILSMDLTAPGLPGIGALGKSTDVTNLGFTIDTGYRVKWSPDWFIEPLATLSYVNTDISDMVFVPGTVASWGDNDSLRGSVGARLGGKAFATDTYWMEASVTGRLWYEFLGDNAVTIFNPGTPFIATDNFNGLFGEVGGSVNVFSKVTGWNGFLNASVLFNDSYTAGSARGGVRYQW